MRLPARNPIVALLRAVRRGTVPAAEAARRMNHIMLEDLVFAKTDAHRELRKMIPEVVFCQGKTIGEAAGVIARLVELHGRALGTRADASLADRLRSDGVPHVYEPRSRIIAAGKRPFPRSRRGVVGVLCAGTSDLPVAEEAALTAEFMGVSVMRAYDIGVSGLHRLLKASAALSRADALVVAAGMEGALPSVVGGLAEAPVIAVPTSVGYGASFGGMAALLAMMNSCAPGIAVVNIDNGFGAGYLAAMMMRR